MDWARCEVHALVVWRWHRYCNFAAVLVCVRSAGIVSGCSVLLCCVCVGFVQLLCDGVRFVIGSGGQQQQSHTLSGLVLCCSPVWSCFVE